MNSKTEIRDFCPSKTDELIAFSKQYPWKPAWPEDLMRRFLTELISGPHLVMDTFNGERVAVAALVDKINNKGRNATLEILGLSPHSALANTIEVIIRRAQELLPSSVSGIELTVHDSYALLDKIAHRLGFTLYYETFEMVVKGLGKMKSGLPDEFELSSESDDQELYAVLTQSFQDNVDTSIPDFKVWKANRRRAIDSTTYLAKKDGGILGFLNMISPGNETPEIRTVGVLPEARGKGLGKRLILRALADLASHGFQECALTVAVQNRNALDLYRNLGFREVDHFNVYCWKSDSKASSAKQGEQKADLDGQLTRK